MDGKGRWRDKVFIERLRRSVKYERVYLFEHRTLPALREGLEERLERSNKWRPHQRLRSRNSSPLAT
jgi:putative transposase